MNDVPHFDTYLASVRRFAAIAAAAGATIIFDVGAAAVARYFKIEDECAQAVRLKLLAQ